MNPTIELNFWLRLLGILALETSLVVALAFAAQALTQSAFWRRTIWQSCFVGLLFLVASEFSGVGRGMAVWLAGKPRVERTISARIVPVDEQFIAAPIKSENSFPVKFSEKPEPVLHSIWWPGILWLAGFAIVIARILFARILFLSLRWRKMEITDATLLNRVSELALQLGISRKIHVLESPGFSSPMTFGIARPSIALPKNFAENFNPAEQNAMLAHELAHIAAHDSFWYLIADLTSAFLWWNPLVWLARRRLHFMSELAADESVAILENGPGTLAECLVNLGQRMAHSFGWLGVDGNGFRSHLGQRVERLLNLKPTEKRQHRGWPLIVAKTVFTILFGGLILFTSGWIQNGKTPREKDFTSAVEKSWNNSFASKTFSALSVKQEKLLAKNETSDAGNTAKMPHYDEVTFDTLIYDGISEEQFESFVKTAFSSSAPREDFSAPSNSVEKVFFALSPLNAHRIASQDSVGSKLNGMRLTYQGNPTNRASTCEYFTETRNGNSVVTGAEMNYKTTNVWSFSLVPHKRDGAIDIDLAWRDGGRDVTKKLELPENGIALALRNFSGDSSRNQLVVFSAARLLYTRTFKLNPEIVAERLGMVFPLKSEDGNSDAARTNFQAQLNQKVRSFFETAGVSFDAPGNTKGKALFFNAQTGLLLVRATLDDLEKIQDAIEQKLREPPQVTIETRFLEITDSAMSKIDLNRFTQNAIFSTKKLVASDVFLLGTNITRPNLMVQKTVTNAIPAVIGIFDEAQYKMLHKALENAGAETIALPKVTTLSGRQAQIWIDDPVSIEMPADANSATTSTNRSRIEKIPFGPSLDVIPTVSEGFAIQMTLAATVTEFLGYDKSGPTSLPQARLHSLVDSVKIWDGQTVMLGKIEKGQLTKKAGENQKNLFVFVTATIIDAKGNRVYSEADLSFTTNSVPKQPK